MEAASLTLDPEDFMKRVIQWSVHDVYNNWEKWALELSSFAYQTAIDQARAESDSRKARMKEFIESLAEFQQKVTVVNIKDLPVYVPHLKKDMR